MIEFLFGIVSGFLIHDLITFIRFRNEQKQEIPPEEQPASVLIEFHDGIFYAFSSSDQFLGQNTSLEELTTQLIGSQAKLLLAANDPFVIEKLRQLVSSDKSHHIVDETNQVQ